MKGKYPLESLKVLRGVREQAAARELSDRAAALARARNEVARREALLEAARERARAVAASERDRLAAGELRAADLARAAEHARAAAWHEQTLARDVAASKERALHTLAERDAAARAFGMAHAELSLVERHYERFRAACAREAEKAEEETALERWSVLRLESRKH
ncbi:MAG: hypothetical protein DIU78_018425 [Pseudomonadota bacterium]|nr:MAG: hypothetical protein DIU78_24200 [Pseudomonadota bacterium]